MSKFLIKEKDGSNVVYKKGFFGWKLFVVEDSFGQKYFFESLEKDKLERAIFSIEKKGWVPHDSTILRSC